MTDELKIQSLDPSHHTFFLHILFKYLITVLGAQMKFYIVVKQITAEIEVIFNILYCILHFCK